MKKVLVCSILLLNFLFLSCSDDDNECETINCSPPITFLAFDLVDRSTLKNIFIDETYDPNLLEVFNADDNEEKVEFQFVDMEDYVVAIDLITPDPSIENYTFKISDKILFKLEVETDDNNDECCPFIIYSEINISDADFELNADNGNYEIFVE